MSSRDTILAALRRNAPAPAGLPDAPVGTAYADAGRQFSEALVSVGGKVFAVGSIAEADAELRGLEVYTRAKRIASVVPGLGESNVDLCAMKDPHELEGIDLAIIPGEFGVAENAAVWVAGSRLGPHRAIFVIAQHLVLAVPRDAIIDNMQQAYERIQPERPGFGLFISGPSKTADIEQSLVIGAHGARSCTVFLV
jgi:L-lactate dehydrogenase complex protein LldG